MAGFALIGFTLGAMLFAALFLLTAAVPAPAPRVEPSPEAKGLRFDCTAVSVYDGDGPVACEEGFKVRLSGVAAREMDGTCRPGHPCPDASAEEARTALVNLLGGETGRTVNGPAVHITIAPTRLRCLFAGGTYDRIAAWCVTAQGVDISCAMIASGTALIWDNHWRGHRCPD
jgi:endonuclease YncB( thermonuclease family)